MPNSKILPPVPGGQPFLVWANRYGPAAVDLLNQLSLLEGNLVPYTSSRGRFSISIAGQSAVLALPFQYTSPITDPIANTSSNTAAIISILSMLRTLGFLPTS